MSSESLPGDPPLRGYAKGRAKREAIIVAATEVFGEVGFHGASLRDISARAQISHPGLLHHFSTKADLLAAVLARRDEIDADALEADRAAGLGFFDALVRLVGRNAERPGIVELYAVLSAEATAPDHPAHGYFRERYARVVEGMRAEIEARVGDGLLPEGTDALSAARAVVALMDGLQIQWLLARDSGPALDMAGELARHLRLVARIDLDGTVRGPADDPA